MEFYLAGNPNSGKTTLFNRITGGRYRVGNFSGVTVESKRGKCAFNDDVYITDLPGAFSFSPLSVDEVVAVNALKNSKKDGVIAVLDGTHLKRSAHFLKELFSLGVPVTVAVNFSDDLAKNGVDLNDDFLSSVLGTCAVYVSAKRGDGVDKLLKLAVKNKNLPKYQNGEFIKNINEKLLVKTTKTQRLTDKFDKFLIGRFTGIPIAFLVLFLCFYISTSIGGIFGALLTALFDFLKLKSTFLFSRFLPKITVSLLIDGIFSGVFSVLSFLPQALITFLLLSLLEYVGYTARLAFLTDGIFRKFGLSGKVALCFSSGCACIVNGVISTRIIEEKSERLRAITAVSFMPCGAKIVCLQYLSSFTSMPALCTVCVVFLSFFVSLIVAKIHLIFSNEKTFNDALFDLPTYRFPTMREVFILTKEKSLSFIKKAGSVIVCASIVVWFLSSFDFSLNFGAKNSILSILSSKLKYLFIPLGFYDERLTVAIIAGLFARESIVAVLSQGVIFASEFSVFAYMIFISLYPPCLSAIITARKEFGDKKRFYLMLLSGVICAYFSAMFINLLGNLILGLTKI